MSKATFLAFVAATSSAAIVYGLYFHVAYYLRVGVTLGSPMEAIFLMFVAAVVVVVILAVPIHVALVKLNHDKPAVYLVLGSLLGGLVIGFAETGILWRHPEGFIVGLVAAIAFNYVRASSSLNKQRQSDA